MELRRSTTASFQRERRAKEREAVQNVSRQERQGGQKEERMTRKREDKRENTSQGWSGNTCSQSPLPPPPPPPPRPPPPPVLRGSAGVAFQRVALNPRYSRQHSSLIWSHVMPGRRGGGGGGGGGEGGSVRQGGGGWKTGLMVEEEGGEWGGEEGEGGEWRRKRGRGEIKEVTEDTREEEKQRGGPRRERQRQGQRGEKKKGAMDGWREGGGDAKERQRTRCLTRGDVAAASAPPSVLVPDYNKIKTRKPLLRIICSSRGH